MVSNAKNLSQTSYQEKFNSLFLTLNTEIKPALYSTTLFLLRRMILAIAFVFLSPSHQYFQIVITIFLTLCFLAFQIKYNPMKSKLMNYLEIYNEITFLMTNLILLSFTDYTPDSENISNE